MTIDADCSGYIQTLDGDALCQLAEAGDWLMHLSADVGDFILPGDPLVSLWPLTSDADGRQTKDDEAFASRVRTAFVVGSERLIAEDLTFGLRQLADIALKALSPGINDPTTATMCIDRLAEILLTVANRPMIAEIKTSNDGTPRLKRRNPSFDHLIAVAFRQIRHYGASDVMVAEHLAVALGRIANRVPESLAAPLIVEALLLVQEVTATMLVAADVARVEGATSWARRSTEANTSQPAIDISKTTVLPDAMS